MTNYYYIASDKEIGAGNGTLDLTKVDSEHIPGFDFPIQYEIYNGLEKEFELRVFMQYIKQQMEPFNECTVQVANLLNSNHVELKVRSKHKVLLHELDHPKQILLDEGQLVTIKKVPTYIE
ncbi:hypothetical protein [Metabacillus malikii]|uniref:Uncharacterized protein n=1 Tax=Metabacillus malikii TaxID=1504265 RepID=A0ABT9ZD30_9BACI|nr:hypothetical protein [Metabacillus malikii]MDQ0229920.1 hypothetical protein [Metabacillus malikii]